MNVPHRFLLLENIHPVARELLEAAGHQVETTGASLKPDELVARLNEGRFDVLGIRSRTQVVPDVHAFPGHIACDADSRSEIVVPLIRDGMVIGVLDLDSPKPGRFDEDDRAGLESAAGLLLGASLMV